MKYSALNKTTRAALAVAVATALSPAALASAAYAAENSGTSTENSATTGTNTGDSSASSGDSTSSNTPPTPPSGSDNMQPPSGDASGGQGGQPPSGGEQGGPGGQGGQGGGANTQTFDYSGTYSGVLSASEGSSTSTNESISATSSDQNAVLAQNGATLTVQGATITKSGDSDNADNCNFYGTNSSVLAVGSGTTLNIADSSINSSSSGSNGIFATDGAVINANNTSITTTNGGNSRGLDATYGGVIAANKMTISTQKDHCAAVATDRGGGYISVANSTLATAGSGSPLLYSTGDIEADHVTGTASGSQIAGMEGKNVIRINNSSLTSTNDAISGSDPIKNGVIIYQSTSGDADTSASTQADFELSDSTLTTNISDGAMFYVTNTDANIVLQNSKLSFDASKVELLHAAGNNTNSWGSSGSNSGNATLTAINQELSGNVYADSISKAVLYLTSNSTWTGAVASENATSDGTTASPANVTVNVDASSTWVVSGDTTVGALNVASGGKVVDSSGKTASIVDASGNVLVQGDGSVTVTVSGTYSTSVDTSGAGSIQGASETLSTARANFDALYGTSTAWGTNSEAGTGSDSSSTEIDGGSSGSGDGSGDSGSGTDSSTTVTASSITLNAKTVTSSTVTKAVKAAGTSKSSATALTLGKKVKTVKVGAFKQLSGLKTITVKSAKLSKSSVKGSLKGSSVTKIKVKASSKAKVNKKYVAKYKKAFAKANSGKKVKVVSA